MIWRRGRDSNPRTSCPVAGFQVVQPFKYTIYDKSRNLPIISNIPQFISLFFSINSPILPKCCRNFFCVFGLISKHKIYLFLPLQVAYVFFYKQFFYSFVSGCKIKFDYPMCTGSFDVCHLFTIWGCRKRV